MPGGEQECFRPVKWQGEAGGHSRQPTALWHYYQPRPGLPRSVPQSWGPPPAQAPHSASHQTPQLAMQVLHCLTKLEIALPLTSSQ